MPKLPKVLIRISDGERFLLNKGGRTYSNENSGMHKPHKWPYSAFDMELFRIENSDLEVDRLRKALRICLETIETLSPGLIARVLKK